MKLVFWDGSGVCLVSKRLDWRRVHAPPEARVPQSAGYTVSRWAGLARFIDDGALGETE
ncbi:hypothetical protein [Neorhizobium sp. SHOUNA12A]|uniref:hypothetical protein n=1 Tax=Neorhizobium sp. SHOUNA12A TaxID=2908923 RepID=UPI003862131E